MIGHGRASAAITIVNALSTGVGSAVGVDLHTDARIEVREVSRTEQVWNRIEPQPSSALVREVLKRALERFFPDRPVAADLTLRSEIPVGRGLKSSSAVSSAIILAVAHAAGATPSSLEVARLTATVGRDVGVSATGALDDAMAGLEPGRFVTDNEHDQVLRHEPWEAGLGVALYVPPQQHAPAPNYRTALANERTTGEVAARAALEGDWPLAMRLNTELVERALGYSYGEVRDRLRARGALASGVSGLGPTLVAVARLDDLPRVMAALGGSGAETRTVDFCRSGPQEGRTP